jgi:hypothetical protein
MAQLRTASAQVPGLDDLAAILQVALWASVVRVEDRPVAFTITLGAGAATMALGSSRPLTAAELAKLSMSTLLGVSAVRIGRGDRDLEILGIDALHQYGSGARLEVQGPGAIAIKARSTTVAFVSGDEAHLLDLSVYSRYLFDDACYPVEEEANAQRERRFFDIARAMHGQTHGGMLLVLSATDSGLQPRELAESLESHYELQRPFDGLREIAAEENELFGALRGASSGVEAQTLLLGLRAVEQSHSRYLASVVRTTAVDGAALLSAEGALLAFGCKVRLTNTPRIRRRLPTVAPARDVELTHFGGTRHQAAARFVGRYPGSRAIVSSQDGTISLLQHAGPDEVECLEHAEWAF